MGQYYQILLNNNGRFEHYDRSVDGQYVMAKLMEHSWWNNPTCGAICYKLAKKPMSVWWVGDYADGAYDADNKPPNGWLPDIITDVYNRCYRNTVKPLTLKSTQQRLLDHKYLVNLTKKQFVDCDKYKAECTDDDGDCIHPLPLLTAIGNGAECGDYFGVNKEDVGKWAGDKIALCSKRPDMYREVYPVFKENY